MPILNKRTAFSLSIDGLKRNEGLQVLDFKGKEAINETYFFEIELVINRHDLELDDYLHKPAYLCIDNEDGYGFHGLIQEFVQGKTHLHMTHYHVQLVPRLFYLNHRVNQRIFQQQKVQDIIVAILKDHGILADHYRFELVGLYEPREYCTQYQESDLEFVHRLCEEEGIRFHFEHRKQGHTLVFSDSPVGYPRLPKPTEFKHESGLNAERPTVDVFSAGLRSKTSRVTRRYDDFETSNKTLELAFNGNDADACKVLPQLESFDYPAHFTSEQQGKLALRKSLERLQADGCLAHGQSNQPMLLSGHVFELEDHLRKDWNGGWLLRKITHRGRQPQVTEAFRMAAPDADDGFVQGYRNTFTASPERVTFRPPLKHRKPHVLVSQTAVVTGPKGETIHCDAFGRVKVRMRWDRSGSADEFSSRWVRVSTGWAGNGYGSMVIPRVGMEVLITFEDGDPDCPLLTGYLFNTANTVPYDLPANKTRSVFKTLSYPGGGGGNEVRIEDRQGQEQIFLHAQRDFLTQAKNDHTLEIGNEQRTSVQANVYREHFAEEHHTTHGLRTTQLNADDSLNVAGSINTQAGQAVVMRAGKLAQVQAGERVVLNAGDYVGMSVGSEYFTVTASGIFCSSLPVLGGMPIGAIPPNIQPPQLPGESPQEAAGRLMALSPCLPEFSWENDPEPVEELPEPVVCKNCLLRARNQAAAAVSRTPQSA